MAVPQVPVYNVEKDTGGYMRIAVEIPGLETRRTNSLRFKGLRPQLRKAARNADIIFAAGKNMCSLEVALRVSGEEVKQYSLQLQNLPQPVKPPPKSFYEIHPSVIILFLSRQK